MSTKKLVKSKDSIIDTILTNYKNYKSDSTVISSVGQEEISNLKQISDILDAPVSALMSEEGSVQDKMSKSLLEIKSESDKLNPNNFNLNPGWIGRAINSITGNNAMNKYATKFSSVKSSIESIGNSLNEGMIMIKSDNDTFIKDKERFRKSADSLIEKIDYLKQVNEDLDRVISAEEDIEKQKFLADKVSFDLKSHIIDLQTIHGAAQQGLIALDILITNNKELIKSVERTRNISVTVLSIGFTIATGLSNQKKVLDTVNEVNAATSKIMLQNAEMLKTQGLDIQKQASTSLLNLEDMKSALQTLEDTVVDLETFRFESLPKMQETINQFTNISSKVNLKLIK